MEDYGTAEVEHALKVGLEIFVIGPNLRLVIVLQVVVKLNDFLVVAALAPEQAEHAHRETVEAQVISGGCLRIFVQAELFEELYQRRLLFFDGSPRLVRLEYLLQCPIRHVFNFVQHLRVLIVSQVSVGIHPGGLNEQLICVDVHLVERKVLLEALVAVQLRELSCADFLRVIFADIVIR